MSDDLDRDLKARFDRELASVPVPATWSFRKRATSPLGLAATVAVVAALLVGATVGGLALRADRESRSGAVPSASPSPSPSASPTGGAVASPIPTPTTAPASGNVFENRVLGYRITMPDGYRRSVSGIETAQGGSGGDYFTRTTEREEAEWCLQDSGDVGFPRSSDPDINVTMNRNPGGISAVEWATTPRFPGAQPRSTHQKVESTTINGLEAVRLIADNATAVTNAFVIRANDRMYDISMPFGLRTDLPKTWLDEIAQTFVAIQPTPFPSPTATPQPRAAARELADALVRAFAARDADAVARLMPSCWLNVTSWVDGQGTGGVLYRSMPQFTQSLRERFAKGDVTVTIDPSVQVEREELYIRSDWRYADRTTRIDLYLRPWRGKWEWFIAKHTYTRAEVPAGCIPYRSPFASGSC